VRIPRPIAPPAHTPRAPARGGPAALQPSGLAAQARRLPLPPAVLAALALAILLAALALTGHFPAVGPDQALALRDRLLALHARHPVASVAAYVAGYVLMTSCSIPGAVFLTLTGGAVFGFGVALAAVSAASTAGACVAFLCARHLLRDTVHRLWPRQLARIDAAMAEGLPGSPPCGPAPAGPAPSGPAPSGLASPGALCLLGLRCVAVMPYWLVNLLFGVTAMRLSTFATVSLFGMLPLNAIYVHAGAELGRIRHLGDIISLRTGLALCLLAVAPLALRRAARMLEARRCAGHRAATADAAPPEQPE